MHSGGEMAAQGSGSQAERKKEYALGVGWGGQPATVVAARQ